ncbi:MAG: LexA family protein [bacterium]
MEDIILEWIKEFIDTHGYSPSFREIGIGVNLPSTSQVKTYVDTLIEEGKLTMEPGKARTLRLA